MRFNVICHRLMIVILLFCIAVLTGCATIPDKTDASLGVSDPYEKINRVSYDFTDQVDRIVMEPVVDAYIDYVPGGAQRVIGNFYDNLAYPNVVLNTFLQGKVNQGFESSLRFLVNSTFGVAGLFDLATYMGLEKHDEDFGQTLAVWGVESDTYLFVPLLGPSNERDITNIPVSVATNALFYAGYIVGAAVIIPLTALGAIDKRARLKGPMRIRDQAALDPYLFVREASIQQRQYLIYDGDLPLDSYGEPFQDNPLRSTASDGASD